VKIIADLKTGKLLVLGKVFSITNEVRTRRFGNRRSHEVVRSIPSHEPYDPYPFPKGVWHVTGTDWQKEIKFDRGTYGPVKIRTDAWQMVNVWELDREGDYLRETGRTVKDTCYWLHYSDSRTTLGCIRLASPDDAVEIANFIIGSDGPVELEVT
jgi:hypothetical protein